MWRFGNHLLVGVNRKVHQIHRKHLIILIDHILVLVQLYVLLLVVEIYRLKPFWQWNDFVHKLLYWTTIRFPHCHFIQNKTELVLGTEGATCCPYLVVAHCEYHPVLFYLVTLGDYFREFVEWLD